VSNKAEMTWVVYSAVRRLQPNAYGVTIMDAVNETLEQDRSFGWLYVTLDKLEADGFLTSEWGEATPERGNRRKRYYRTVGGKFLPAPDAAAERTPMPTMIPAPS
jgi:PadR family transcriptional regulator